MPVHVVTHDDCLLHEAGPAHPERPDRLRAVLEALRAPAFADLVMWHEAPAARAEDLLRVHPQRYLEFLEKVGATGGWLDPDTAMNTHSWQAALLAAGGVVHATELALDTGVPAFAAVRPPGHHALAERAMGFCLLANVSVAARAAQARGGVERVLIVDWDVHHGNGTQALVEEDPAIRFVSMHQWPHYPGTGDERERGVGNVWNLPRRAGLPPSEYVADLLSAIDEATDGWDPDLILISAGFDSMAGDPLAGFTLEASNYADIAEHLKNLGRPIAIALEGGYELGNLTAGVSAVVRALA